MYIGHSFILVDFLFAMFQQGLFADGEYVVITVENYIKIDGVSGPDPCDTNFLKYFDPPDIVKRRRILEKNGIFRSVLRILPAVKVPDENYR